MLFPVKMALSLQDIHGGNRERGERIVLRMKVKIKRISVSHHHCERSSFTRFLACAAMVKFSRRWRMKLFDICEMEVCGSGNK